MDHSILDQSSVPRNINEYTVTPHTHSNTHKHLNTFQKPVNSKDSLGQVDIAHSTFNSDQQKHGVSNASSLNILNGFMNITDARKNDSNYQRNMETFNNGDKYVINTVNLNSSVTMDTHESLLRCNKSDLQRVNLKRGRCFYAIRLGNMLKLCRKIKCRSSSKRSKHLKSGDYNTNGDAVTPWLIQHFVDAL